MESPATRGFPVFRLPRARRWRPAGPDDLVGAASAASFLPAPRCGEKLAAEAAPTGAPFFPGIPGALNSGRVEELAAEAAPTRAGGVSRSPWRPHPEHRAHARAHRLRGL